MALGEGGLQKDGMVYSLEDGACVIHDLRYPPRSRVAKALCVSWSLWPIGRDYGAYTLTLSFLTFNK